METVMLARIFVNRPVLACVLSVVILLLGGISAGLLSVAEYPEVTPPMVRVSAVYPGANARVVAVGDLLVMGQQDYSMRVWLDPDKLQSRNLTVGDVIKVLREQNVQVAAGQIGQPPVPRGQDFQYTLSTLGRLTEAEQFAG